MSRFFFIFGLIFLFALTGCKSDSKDITLKIGATPVPHAEILNFIKPILAKQHIKLNIIEFTDYIQPNEALSSKDIDANFFQHIPYLTKFASDRHLSIKPFIAVHIEPMGIYSKTFKNLNDLKEGAKIGIPNDPTNGGRALMLLSQKGLIVLNQNKTFDVTVADIKDNGKSVKIIELDASQLPRSLEDLDLAVINTNFALEAGLNPLKDALGLESGNSPYVNVVAIRNGDESRPELIALSKALTSPEVKKFILEKYKGAILPVF